MQLTDRTMQRLRTRLQALETITNPEQYDIPKEWIAAERKRCIAQITKRQIETFDQ